MVELTLNLESLDLNLSSNDTLSLSSLDTIKQKRERINENDVSIAVSRNTESLPENIFSNLPTESKQTLPQEQSPIKKISKQEILKNISSNDKRKLEKKISASDYPQSLADDILKESVNTVNKQQFVDKCCDIEELYESQLQCLTQVYSILLIGST